MTQPRRMHPLTPLVDALARADDAIGRVPSALALLALRLALALPFWRSGLTKWDGFFHLSDNAVFLFAEEFRLHLFGGTYPYPAPVLAAYLAGVAEIVLPVLLVIGLATRPAALAILAMTAVIQITVPEGWASFHLPWAAMALTLMVYGAGSLSCDRMLAGVRDGK
jgi:putative oxidoreductase